MNDAIANLTALTATVEGWVAEIEAGGIPADWQPEPEPRRRPYHRTMHELDAILMDRRERERRRPPARVPPYIAPAGTMPY